MASTENGKSATTPKKLSIVDSIMPYADPSGKASMSIETEVVSSSTTQTKPIQTIWYETPQIGVVSSRSPSPTTRRSYELGESAASKRRVKSPSYKIALADPRLKEFVVEMPSDPAPKPNADASATLAVYLASRPYQMFCPNCPINPHVSSASMMFSSLSSMNYTSQDGKQASKSVKPFFNSLFSSSEFSSMFANIFGVPKQQNGDIGKPEGVISEQDSEAVEIIKSDNDDEEAQLSLKKLTLPLLECAIETYTEQSPNNAALDISSSLHNGDPKFLLNTIRTAFSSREILNDSFLKTSAQKSSHPSGIDLVSLRKAYDLIFELEPKALFRSTVFDALEILLSKVLVDPKVLDQEDVSIRYLLIVLEALLDSSDRVVPISIVAKMVKILAYTWDRKGLACDLIIKWLSRFLGDRYHPPPALLSEEIMCAAKTITMIYKANEIASPKPIVSHVLFYNDYLSEKMKTKEEYKVWKRIHGNAGSRLASSTVFTFLDYPILLDPVDACVHHAFYIQTQRHLPEPPRDTETLQARTIPVLFFEIRREFLVQDALDQIITKQHDLKKPLKVKFGAGEDEAQDQGGVQKEFFQILLESLIDPKWGLFIFDERTRCHWINGASDASDRKFELVGVVLGLVVFNGIIVDINLPKVFYKKLLGWEVTFDDFKDSFPEIGKGLEQMLAWSEGDVYDVYLRHFEISYEYYGTERMYELVKNGNAIPVTNENREEYVRLYYQHYVHKYVERQFNAFKKGFMRMCDGMITKLLRPEELELLLCGNRDLNLDDLKNHVKYEGGFDPSHPTIRSFWDVYSELTVSQKRDLLAFVTSSDRIPIRGFSDVSFTIQRNGPDSDKYDESISFVMKSIAPVLPTARTCFGILLLPDYKTKDKLRNKLLVALENRRGFGIA
ncbi:4970_t:CDS:10 [Paraglomus occultum]|uniref:HECT-type E3 ubiquitin transferase n=1 Tax=Paraglomus occultum TaxID=144539 RepID=A0A9N8W8D2_9GLOM|nr:4970_t:CDS:10 [Paraglomus occultum]